MMTTRLLPGATLALAAVSCQREAKNRLYRATPDGHCGPASRNWIGHDELVRGARLGFSMSAKPKLQRGTQAADAQYSFSTAPGAQRR